MYKADDSVDAVLDRMVEAILGEGADFGTHARALGVSRDTIKSWKRRGKVPLTTLKNFALDWKVPIEWLQHGGAAGAPAEPHHASEALRPYGLSEEESALLESYRRATPKAQAALRVLLCELTERSGKCNPAS